LGVVVVILLGIIIFLMLRRRKNRISLSGELPVSPKKERRTSYVPYSLAPAKNFEINVSELEFQKELGNGTAGVVYKGKWRGGDVAIKLLKDFSAKELDNFRRESEVMRKLRPHTNVVQFLGITSASTLYIVTEYLEGGSLYSLLHGKTEISMKMVKTWIHDIAAGMLHIHSEGIFHRDLAARNVLLTRGEQNAKISDFGLSRIASGDANGSKTKADTGPLKWMSPESIRDRTYGIPSDVWSFGVVAWEIIARDDPYPTKEAVTVALEVTAGNPPLRLVPPDYCPAIIVELMKSCFKTAPEQRPDFKEISNRLQHANPADWLVQSEKIRR